MIRRCAILAAIGVLFAATSVAQYNTAEISGVVRDAQGGTLPGATVTALHLASGTKVARNADGAGRFFLPALPAGEYVLTIELRGFRPLTRTGLSVTAGEKLDLPVTLDVGQVSESVTVTAEVPVLQTATTDISDVITNRQVVELPLNGRMFLQLALLTDGAAIPPGGTRGAALEQAGSLPAVYGQRSGHNIYLIDGVKVTDEYFNNLVISPSVDAIREFKIQKTMYPAEFGGKSSALINVVTRSGENTFHGSMVEFGRNDALDARNYFDDPAQPVPPLRQHQFGLSLGGPIARDRTFFFFSYEGQRVQRSLTRTFSVPTSSLRAGNFSGLPSICDPLTRRADGSCTPFTGNQIPGNRLDPIAIALLAQVPLPTGGGLVQNLLAVGRQTGPADQFSLRVDHRLSANDQLYGRFTTYAVSDDQPFGTSSLNETLVPGFGRIVTTNSRNLALGSTHVFGPRWVNELRFGYLSAGGGQVSPNQGVNFAGATGLRGVSTDPRDSGYPQVAFGGLFSTIGDPTSFVSREDRSYELYDNVIADKGDHRFKFGGYLFHLDFNPVNPNQARGAFTYSGQWTGNAFADFLLGYPSSAQVGLGRADEHGRSTWLHVYAQDDWRVRSNLTLNYGLRYEVNGQMTDVDNRLSAIDLTVPGGRFVVASDESGRVSSSADALLSQMPIPYVSSQAAGWTNGLLRPSYLRFAPRVGAAWTLDSDTVVHASFGVFLNQWAYSVQQAFAQTLPFFFAKTVNAAADAVQPGSTTGTMLLAPSNGTASGSTMNHDFQTEYAKNYSVSLQRALGGSTVVEIGFLRSTITGADSSTVLNVPAPGPGPIAPRRPVPQLANITAIRWDGYSIYNGLTVRLERRPSHGLAFSANYTLSKAVDDASDPGATASETNLPQDVRNMAVEEAVSSFDHRHRFVGNFTYALGAGFQLTGIVTLQSGAPFTVNIGTDRANIGSGPAQRPDAVCDPNTGGARTAEQWFNTACFALPAPFTFGNAARNSVVGPGYADVDAGVQKDFTLAGRLRLQLRWEVFNVLKHTNFDIPNRTAFTANFGRIFSALPSRQMQLGARLTF